MAGEAWELRREARRCAYGAITSGTATQKKMFQGLAAFYQSLADSAADEESRPTRSQAAPALQGSQRTGEQWAEQHREAA
jgi:hypothetical protein